MWFNHGLTIGPVTMPGFALKKATRMPPQPPDTGLRVVAEWGAELHVTYITYLHVKKRQAADNSVTLELDAQLAGTV